jgi:hypothetical protein
MGSLMCSVSREVITESEIPRRRDLLERWF